MSIGPVNSHFRRKIRNLRYFKLVKKGKEREK